MRALLARLRRRTATADDDRGFTIVEVVTAMALLGGLMVIVGGAMLSAFSGLNTAMTRTDEQAQAQTAAEWAGRLLRYMAVPEGQASAVVEASASSITFFTESGTGGKHDVPYRARLYIVTNADGTRSMCAQVWTPTQVSGGWTWSGTPVTRTLLTLPSTATTPMLVAVWVRNPITVPEAAARNATPASSAALTLAVGEQVESVVVQVGDRNDPRSLVTQQVRVVNTT